MIRPTLFAAALTSLVSISAQAACTAAMCDDVYVDRIYSTLNGTIYVNSSGDENALNCTLINGTYMTIENDSLGANNMYNLLLAAQMADKKVLIRTQVESNNCQINYVILDRQ